MKYFLLLFILIPLLTSAENKEAEKVGEIILTAIKTEKAEELLKLCYTLKEA